MTLINKKCTPKLMGVHFFKYTIGGKKMYYYSMYMITLFVLFCIAAFIEVLNRKKGGNSKPLIILQVIIMAIMIAILVGIVYYAVCIY